MVLLSEVVERHQGELEPLHGSQLLRSHRQALQAMHRCRRQGGDLMVLRCGVRVEPELERQLDQLARQLGKSCSACIREAIRQYLIRYGDGEEARRQSLHLAQLEQSHRIEQVPDWNDWTA